MLAIQQGGVFCALAIFYGPKYKLADNCLLFYWLFSAHADTTNLTQSLHTYCVLMYTVLIYLCVSQILDMECKLLVLLCMFIHVVNCDDKPNVILLFADDVSSTYN